MVMFFLKCWVYLLYGMDTIGVTPRGLRNFLGMAVVFTLGFILARHL